MPKLNVNTTLLVATLICFWASSPLFAQSKSKTQSVFQFDDIIYTLPDGWKKGKTSDDHVTIYDRGSAYSTIKIFRSDDVPRFVKRWIEKKMNSVLDGDEKFTEDMGDPELPIGKLKAYMSARTADRDAFLGYTVVGKEKINIVIMEVRIPRDKDDAPEFEKKLRKQFLPFCLNLKFVNLGAKPLLGNPVAGELEGTFSGLHFTYSVDLSMNFEQEFYTFSTSGRFVRGLPKSTSVKSIDFDKAIIEKPNHAGNYRIRRGKIYFEFADGTKDSDDYKKTKNGFDMGQSFSPVTVPADGTKFDGLFRDLHYSGFTPGSGIDGGVTSERSLRFTKSGKYTATRFSAAFGNFENGVGDTSGGFSNSNKRPKVSGSYEVKDGTIRLKDKDGNVAVCSLVQLGDDLIYVDGVQYLNRDKSKKKK